MQLKNPLIIEIKTNKIARCVSVYLFMACLTLSSYSVIPISHNSIIGVTSDDYFVGFGAKKADASSSVLNAGHAFVAFGKGDPLTCSQNGEYETWGFYGNPDDNYSFFLHNIPGLMSKDDITDPDLFFYVKVSFEEYIKAYMVKDAFIQSSTDYNLYKRNCVSYADAVAQTLSAKIKIPDKSSFADIPVEYMQNLIKLNRE